MAMAHWLQAVTDEEAAALRRDSSSVNRLDSPVFSMTHFFAAVEHFAAAGGPLDPAEAPEHIAAETERLAAFYTAAADRNLGAALYVT
ncbi:hypothetical protein [Actinomadura atramentaria]|uniref:hypothetical protein n=1 Tax=Actinomadura atramentaria TaxID=1990 RepID=UPI0003634226|nr:hypothetical protein [Actinomadura atramentaria]